jgi:8-oxo-dGTP diphosphatase
MTESATRRVVTISTLVVIQDGRMLLVRKEGATAFILPGGKPEAGESLEQAVRREVREELGSEIEGLAYAASFQDEAADAPDLDVLVHVHVGRLASRPRAQAEIRDVAWCDMSAPAVPIAPSLARQIFGYFGGAAAMNVALTSAVNDLRGRVQIGEYADRHLVESLVQAAVAVGDIAPDAAPEERILMPMRAHHRRGLAKLRREIAETDESIARDRRRAERLPEVEENEEDRELFARYRRDVDAKRTRLLRDLARAEDVSRRLDDDPASLLLPLGTTVATRAPEILDGDWPMPVEGTRGVVVGYSTLFNRPNVVAFAQDVKETGGDVVLFDEEEANRLFQVNYLPEELEVVADGELVDGTPVDRPGWWPTHSHHDRDSILYSESMVVRGDGRLWRVQPCSSLPECTQIALDTDEGRTDFDHLKPLVRAS